MSLSFQSPIHCAENEYNMRSFQLATDDDLKELCSVKGPRTILKSCREKLKAAGADVSFFP